MSLARQALLYVLATATARAQAQCFEWSERFSANGVDSLTGPLNNAGVVDTVVFDDGSGPALYACGVIDTAGNVAVSNIARWDGAQWAPFGGNLSAGDASGPVTALAVFDDGSGSALYAGGFFHTLGGVSTACVAKWNGSTWQAPGGGFAHAVNDLFVFDDGSGSKLYVAGDGTGGVSANFAGRLGTWDGANWSLVGGADPHFNVIALASYDDGSGPALYAGGEISSVGALSASNLIRWNGSAWSDVGGGVSGGVVRALTVHDDGSGAALYAAGAFTMAGGTPGFTRIARWDGAWSTVGTGASGVVRALASYDDGATRQLYAGGDFVNAGGTQCNGVARWSGASWSALGAPAGLTSGLLGGGGQTFSLNVLDDGSGDALYVAGRFVLAGAVDASHIARWNAAGWSSLGSGGGLQTDVSALESFDDGSGPELFAAGDFVLPGASGAHRLARLDTNGIVASTVPVNGDVQAFHEYDDGSGKALYAGGGFSNIDGVAANRVARWDGTHWSALGVGVGVVGAVSAVRAMTTFNDGGGDALWVAGSFNSAGGAPAKRVARWDGSTWFAPTLGPSNDVYALAVYDDGSGGALYVAGEFAKVGTQYVHSIAKWDGVNWSALGQGLSSGRATSLAVFDDGTGEKLYVAGNFAGAPPITAYRIARWDGIQWEAVGDGVGVPSSNWLINSLAVFDDGTGPALIAGGYFVNSGVTPLSNLARWTGAQWVDFHGGANSRISMLSVVDDGSFGSPRLFLGGSFTQVGDTISLRIASLERACPCVHTYCVAGTSVNGCVPAISATGVPSAAGGGGFVVSVDDMDGQRAGLLFYGLSGATNAPWGATSSTLCVKPPQQRTGQGDSGGTGGACDGVLTLDWDAYVAAHPTALGMPLQAGTSVSMQGWYRDPGNAKTTGLSDALEFLVCP